MKLGFLTSETALNSQLPLFGIIDLLKSSRIYIFNNPSSNRAVAKLSGTTPLGALSDL
jgi:hypothetical protein